MTLGERIKVQRKNCGLSQEKLAELAGVSRQAVTKWEAGNSAPSTENLLKLAEILGITVDVLLGGEERQEVLLAEQIYHLQKAEREAKIQMRRKLRKRNLLYGLFILVGYLLIYLIGRILGGSANNSSVVGWIIGADTNELRYLFGWLLKRNLFWIALVVSIIPALFGKYKFAYSTLAAFALGLLLGETFGNNPAGAAYGQGHFGWAIWGGIYLFSIVMGIILECISKEKLNFQSKGLWIWCGTAVVGIVSIVLFVLASIPTVYGN